MAAYVTVGSTGFDELVRTVSTREFLQALAGRGFNRLVVQCGYSFGLFKPPPTESETFGIAMESFDYTTWPQRLVDQADLIICHAGAGSILEALHSGKPTIAVVNRGLADNHQNEVASELATTGYLVVTEPRNLASVVAESGYASLRPYPRADPRPIGEVIDEETML